MTRKTLSLLFVILTLAVCAVYNTHHPVHGQNGIAADEPLPPKGSRILVVAPHCNDETLAAGALLHQAVKNGIEVKVVVVTRGDGYAYLFDRDFHSTYPTARELAQFDQQRQAESLRAMRELGVSRKDVVFLGYPERSIAHLWSENWSQDLSYIDRNKQAGSEPDSVDHGYTGENLIKDLSAIIDEFHPTDIYFPHPLDEHPDHWAVGAFMKYLLEMKESKFQEHLYIVHSGRWPVPKQPQPSQAMTPPSLVESGTVWRQFTLLPGEAVQKTSAILAYASQVKVMRSFLLSFVRSSELFGVLPDYHVPAISSIPSEGLSEKAMAVKDQYGDIPPLDVDKAADIHKIYCAVVGGQLVMEIEAAAQVGYGLTYNIHGRAFAENGTVSRFDLYLHDGKLEFKAYDGNSMTQIPGITGELVNSRYRVNIPLTVFPKIKSLFLNGDTAAGPYLLDKTPWRMLRFSAESN